MTDPIPLAGKTAVVTGASRGIGKAIAMEFARAGADLAILSRTEAELSKVAEEARALGQSPGGDIFIHGQAKPFQRRSTADGDWTWGCIAVSNREMEDIYAMVRDGTPIVINA